MDELFVDFENHLSPRKAKSTVATDDLRYEYGYMLWFFRVSHPYIIQDAPRNPPRPNHWDILEKERARADHATDVLLKSRCIMELAWDDIDRGLFLDGSDGRGVFDAIMAEAHEALFCMRQRKDASRVTDRLIIIYVCVCMSVSFFQLYNYLYFVRINP